MERRRWQRRVGAVEEGRHGRHADTLNRGLWERHKSAALGCVLLAPGAVFTRVFRARTKARIIYVFLCEPLDKTGALCILTSDSPATTEAPAGAPSPPRSPEAAGRERDERAGVGKPR